MWPVVVFFLVAGGCFMVVFLVLGSIWLVWWGIRKATRRKGVAKFAKDMTDEELVGLLPNKFRGGGMMRAFDRVHQWAQKPKSAQQQVQLVFSMLYMDMILEFIGVHGRDAESALIEALKDPRAQDGEVVGDSSGKIAARPLTIITTLLREYPSEAALEAALPLTACSEPAVRRVAAGFLAAMGLEGGKAAVLSVLKEDKGAADDVIKGLVFAVTKRRRVFKDVIDAIWPELESRLRGQETALYALRPNMRVMVAGDAARAWAAFESMGMTTTESEWFEALLEAFEVNAGAFPREVLEGLIKRGLEGKKDRKHFFKALGIWALLPEEKVERQLVAMGQSADKGVRNCARSALAKRYRAGVCAGDPGPHLSDKEHGELMEACKQLYWVENIWGRVMSNGLDQYPDLIKRKEWEACALGMEKIGAVKCAKACREVIRHFGPVIDVVGTGREPRETSAQIQERLGEEFKRLEREIADEGEMDAGLIDAYVIRNRDLFLRNRGDTSWEQLI